MCRKSTNTLSVLSEGREEENLLLGVLIKCAAAPEESGECPVRAF